MESICRIRDVYKSLNEFEGAFQRVHGLSINEAMVLCSLSEAPRSSGEIADYTAMLVSHASKVIRAVEEKGYISRRLGEKDRRQMYFRLSPAGLEKLREMKCNLVPIPSLLLPLFEHSCMQEIHPSHQIPQSV
ncbi:MAG: MarR family winged helix-turn-helix transcriptional regulator [Bacteroidales bacterium]